MRGGVDRSRRTLPGKHGRLAGNLPDREFPPCPPISRWTISHLLCPMQKIRPVPLRRHAPAFRQTGTLWNRHEPALCQPVPPGVGRNPENHLLHVRLPLRHKCASEVGKSGLYRGQPRPPGQQGRALRQRLRRDHADHRPVAPHRPDETHRPARVGGVREDLMGRGAGDCHRLAGTLAPPGPRETRLLHRARPKPVFHQLLGPGLWHPQLRRPRRVLLGQHGRRRDIQHRRQLLGIRRARLGPCQTVPAVRRRRRP